MRKSISALIEAKPSDVFDRALAFIISMDGRIIFSDKPHLIEASQGSYWNSEPMKAKKRLKIVIRPSRSGSRVDFTQDFSGGTMLTLLLIFVINIGFLFFLPPLEIFVALGSAFALLIWIPTFLLQRGQAPERFWAHLKRSLTSDNILLDKCPKCWYPVSDRDIYCQNCGRQLDAISKGRSGIKRTYSKR